MVFIGPLLFIIGLISLLPVIPIPGIRYLSATIKGIGSVSGPAGFVLIIIGSILWSMGI